jgi:hypothetical protein
MLNLGVMRSFSTLKGTASRSSALGNSKPFKRSALPAVRQATRQAQGLGQAWIQQGCQWCRLHWPYSSAVRSPHCTTTPPWVLGRAHAATTWVTRPHTPPAQRAPAHKPPKKPTRVRTCCGQLCQDMLARPGVLAHLLVGPLHAIGGRPGHEHLLGRVHHSHQHTFVGVAVHPAAGYARDQARAGGGSREGAWYWNQVRMGVDGRVKC